MTSPARPREQAPLLRLTEITRTYQAGDQAVYALRGISFSVEPGELVAIMGASGCGKSTLMNLLGCLDRPTSGRYELAGRDVSRLSPDELADVRNQTIGFVFQGFHLLARTTALENVELPLLYGATPMAEQSRRAREALASVGLAERAMSTPTQLSGGQQQRVAIARALVTNPSLILADEPTGNLDSKTSAEIMELVAGLHRSGMTIVLVTHEADIAAYAERVIIMRDGLIVDDRRQAPSGTNTRSPAQGPSR